MKKKDRPITLGEVRQRTVSKTITEYGKACQVCGIVYPARRTDGLYCGDRCKFKAFYDREKGIRAARGRHVL